MESCAFTKFRFDRDHSLVTFDDSVAHRQAKTQFHVRPWWYRKARRSLAHFFLHAGSGIGKSQSQPVAVAVTQQILRLPPCGIASTALTIRFTNTSRNSEALPSVQRLFLGIQSHVDVRAFSAGLVLPTRAGDFDRVAQEAADIQQLQFSRHRFARESLNAPNRGRGIFGSSDNDAQTANQLFILDAPQNQLRSAQNGGQRIIEIVGDA